MFCFSVYCAGGVTDANLVEVIRQFSSWKDLKKFFKSLGISLEVITAFSNNCMKREAMNALSIWKSKKNHLQVKATRETLLKDMKNPIQYISEDAMENIQDQWDRPGKDVPFDSHWSLYLFQVILNSYSPEKIHKT